MPRLLRLALASWLSWPSPSMPFSGVARRNILSSASSPPSFKSSLYNPTSSACARAPKKWYRLVYGDECKRKKHRKPKKFRVVFHEQEIIKIGLSQPHSQ